MAETVRFMSKHRGYKTYVNGMKIVFEDGSFSTDDVKTIEGLRKSSDFGITLIEVKKGDLKEKEVSAPAPEIGETVQEELNAGGIDNPISVSKKAKGKKR